MRANDTSKNPAKWAIFVCTVNFCTIRCMCVCVFAKYITRVNFSIAYRIQNDVFCRKRIHYSDASDKSIYTFHSSCAFVEACFFLNSFCHFSLFPYSLLKSHSMWFCMQVRLFAVIFLTYSPVRFSCLPSKFNGFRSAIIISILNTKMCALSAWPNGNLLPMLLHFNSSRMKFIKITFFASLLSTIKLQCKSISINCDTHKWNTVDRFPFYCCIAID